VPGVEGALRFAESRPWLGQKVRSDEQTIYMCFHAVGGKTVPVLVVVYVDDFLVVGSREAATAAHKEIEKSLGFSPKDDYECDEFVGIQAHPLPKMPDGTHRVLTHQTTYSQHLTTDFEKDHYGGKELSAMSTPSLSRDEPGRNVPSNVPDLRSTAQKP